MNKEKTMNDDITAYPSQTQPELRREIESRDETTKRT